jgi:hypothetical protein
MGPPINPPTNRSSINSPNMNDHSPHMEGGDPPPPTSSSVNSYRYPRPRIIS